MRCHAMRCQAMILVDAILRDGFARQCQTMRWYGTANEIKAMTIGCIVRRLAIVAMFPTIFPSLVHTPMRMDSRFSGVVKYGSKICSGI